MFRSESNPPSRFEELRLEWDDEAPPARLRVYDDETQSILSHNESPDLDFRWSANPYRGCTHACAYCYARPTHEYLGWGAGTDFDSRILVKRRAPELLAQAFARRSWVGERILFSGNVDAWQPLEHRLGITRACLEVCLAHRNPIAVITKSNLIERDVELLAELHRVAGVAATISIPFLDPALARAIEPGAPTPARRLRALATLHAAGVPVGVNIAPVIPGLNDREIPGILQEARARGAAWAGKILVRLPGAVAQVFPERLAEALPGRAESVMARVRRMRGGKDNNATFGQRFGGEGPEWEATRRLFQLWADRLGFGPWPSEPSPSPFRRPGPQLGLFG